MPEPYVVASELTKIYAGHAPAVDGASFSLERGEMLALLGPSGCGKTTILRMIAGLIAPTSGSIRVAGKEVADLPVHRRGMGMVFQAYALLPHLTVAENVGFGLAMRGVGRAEREQRVAAALAMVKLGDKGGLRPSQLSGGQQQRAAIARSLVIEPSLLLLDEPLSNLDAKLRDALRGEIRELQQRTATTAIFVTHDQSEALATADRIAVMSAGRIEQIGTPTEIFEQPATRFVASFIGEGNFFEGRVERNGSDGALVQVAGLGALRVVSPAPLHGEVTLLLRPHHIEINLTGEPRPDLVNRIAGHVESIVYTGEIVTLGVRAGDLLLTVNRFARGIAPSPGAAVTLGWRAEDMACIGASP